MTPSPIWTSAFRPFYLLGAIYAPLLAAAWVSAWLGGWVVPLGLPLKLVHGHEFIFGFAAAIILGVVLTALPSWAGTEEIEGGRLKLLVALWLAGRIGFWGSPWIPAPLPAMMDCMVYAAAMVMLAPPLLRAKNRFYLLLLPILAALFGANLAYHHAAAGGDVALAALALRAAIWSIVVLYVLKGGVLAPIFTGNALREKGRGDQASFLIPLEICALLALLLLAALDLAGAPRLASGGAALACTLLYGWRSVRWQGWRVADVPLLLAMHLGFAWLLLAFLLKAVTDLTGRIPEGIWLHAFTVGSLGMMMLGLMTRVSQRHTGRPLCMPRPMQAACLAMFLAALFRVSSGLGYQHTTLIGLSTLLWAGAFLTYLGCYAIVLVSPSLPRTTDMP